MLVSNVFDLHVPLLVWILAPVEKIANVFAVDFQCTHFYEDLLLEMPLVPVDFVLYEQGYSGQDARELIYFLRLRVDELRGIGRPLHRVSLSRSSLAICKYASILPIQCGLNKWLDFIEYFFLAGVGQKDVIEIVNDLAVLGHIQRYRLMLYFHDIALRILLQLGKSNQVLVKHVDLLLLKVDWFDSAKDSHVAFQVRDLLLLNFSDQFILVQV